MSVNTPLPKIMVAPNGARRTKNDHPALPMTIKETVETAVACHAAGAAAIHAHVRDGEGKHVLDAGLYRELLDELAVAVPDMAVQITTEAVGRFTPEQQRKTVREVMPKFVSVAVAEMIPDDDFNEARQFYSWAREADIQIQHLLYSPQEVLRFKQVIDAGIIPPDDLKALFVLGKYATQQESDPGELLHFLGAKNATGLALDWGICAFGHSETRCLAAALATGAKARVGFENSLWNADGSLAKDNAERVQEIAALV